MYIFFMRMKVICFYFISHKYHLKRVNSKKKKDILDLTERNENGMFLSYSVIGFVTQKLSILVTLSLIESIFFFFCCLPFSGNIFKILSFIQKNNFGKNGQKTVF